MESRQEVACLHEVAGRDGFADVGVVVARLEVCAHQRRAQPGCYPHLRRHMHASVIKPQPPSDADCLSNNIIPTIQRSNMPVAMHMSARGLPARDEPYRESYDGQSRLPCDAWMT